MNKSHFSITEYSFIASSKSNRNYSDHQGNLFLKPSIFNELNIFVKKNLSNELDFLTIGFKKNIGDVIKTKNYVGIIQTQSGISIEILPKIFGSVSINKTKEIFLKMLKTLRNVPFISSSMANINVSKLHIFDVFIKMFLNELEILVRRGLKSSYLLENKNLNILKGKINFSQNIKRNLLHKEKFFCEFDDYNMDRPENRLIKSTLISLKNKSLNSKIEQEILKFLFVFDNIKQSKISILISRNVVIAGL